MSEAQFSNDALIICLSVLMVFMVFIILDLGKKSQAGKWGTLVLFLVLGLGVFGFIFKNVLVEFMLSH